jgi:hypothetical protein
MTRKSPLLLAVLALAACADQSPTAGRAAEAAPLLAAAAGNAVDGSYVVVIRKAPTRAPWPPWPG